MERRLFGISNITIRRRLPMYLSYISQWSMNSFEINKHRLYLIFWHILLPVSGFHISSGWLYVYLYKVLPNLGVVNPSHVTKSPATTIRSTCERTGAARMFEPPPPPPPPASHVNMWNALVSNGFHI